MASSKKMAASPLDPEDGPQRVGAFSAHQLWVTPYKQNERYAAGVYPTDSKGEDGLAVWTKANRPIENTDIVAWYTMGFHHMPRAEDWPVMPVMWHDFVIRPFDFFPQNRIVVFSEERDEFIHVPPFGFVIVFRNERFRCAALLRRTRSFGPSRACARWRALNFPPFNNF